MKGVVLRGKAAGGRHVDTSIWEVRTVDEWYGSLVDILHVPFTDERPWVSYAACRDMDSDVFFPGDPEQEAYALSVCGGCAVRVECLEYALEVKERYGVWGGTTEKERRRFLRRSA